MATVQAAQQFVDMFTALGGLMAERVPDIRDVRDRIVAELTGQGEPGIPSPEVPSVLLADDLAPADTAGLDPTRVIGLATRLGGTTSHTAIIARQLGLPCVVAVEGLDDVPRRGRRCCSTVTRARSTVGPDAADARRRVETARLAAEVLAGYSGPARTKDGDAVQVLANVQDGAGARLPWPRTPRGSGCSAPSCRSSATPRSRRWTSRRPATREVFEAFAGRKVVLRTLDAGSDKPLAFATLPDEANPALGVRGLRIARRDPGMLDRQLDAVAEAAAPNRVRRRGSWRRWWPRSPRRPTSRRGSAPGGWCPAS